MTLPTGNSSSVPCTTETRETAPPPTYASPASASASHPTASTLHRSSPEPFKSDQSLNTGSARVQIPKLSAATTALLARITGNIKGGQQSDDHPNSISYGNPYTPVNSSRASRSQGLDHQRSQNPTRMRSSSAILDLPTPPFVYSHHMTAPAVSHQTTAATSTSIPALPHGNNVKPGLVAIAPRPAIVPSSLPPAPLQFHQPSQPQLSPQRSLAPLAPLPTLAPGQVPIPPPASQSQPVASATEVTSPNLTLSKPKKQVASARSRKTTNGARRPKKRKRGNGSDSEVIRAGDSSTDESDVAPITTQTKSGRQVNRPSLYVPPPASSPSVIKENNHSHPTDGSDNTHTPSAAATRKRRRVFRRGKDAIITCVHCQRAHSPLSNMIVFCDECNSAWHQLCHDPPVSAEVIAVREKEWFCRDCRPIQIDITQPTVVRSNPGLGLESAQTRPPVHLPLVLPKTEVGGEGFLEDERRGYLSTFSHASLVELLVTISSSHPTLPLFPRDLKSSQSSSFSFLPKTAAAPPENLPLGSSTTDPASAVQNGISTTNAHAVPPSRWEADDPDDELEYEIEEHRLYPRAGNGFHLPFDTEDMDIMREDIACPTFSYTLHGPARLRAQDGTPAPVCGTV